MRILIVEPNAHCAESIETRLKLEGFSVQTTDTGEDGVDLAKVYDFDIAIVGAKQTDISGYDITRRVRAAKVRTPIIILSTSSHADLVVKALGVGADDYMTMPFHNDELVARIHAIVRRTKGHAQSIITTGDLVLNLDTKLVTIGGQAVRLTGKEYQMLELLSLRKGQTLTKEMFLNHLYGGMDEPELKIIDVFICKLRKKIAAAHDGDSMVETIWGRGYILRDPNAQTVTTGPSVVNPVGDDRVLA